MIKCNRKKKQTNRIKQSKILSSAFCSILFNTNLNSYNLINKIHTIFLYINFTNSYCINIENVNIHGTFKKLICNRIRKSFKNSQRMTSILISLHATELR